VCEQHPALAAYRSGRLPLGRSIAWSELIEPASLRKLPLYVDYYASRGTRDQLVCVVGTEPAWRSTAIADVSPTATTRSSTS
jgi:hypothetical protein